MRSTYCPELWRSVSIDNHGDVFCRRLKMPIRLGNIYLSPLASMINSEEIVRCRQASLDGNLACYGDCTWVRDVDVRRRYSSPIMDYDDLKNITIVFGERCNISCIMCNQRKRERPDSAILDHKALIQNIDPSPFETILLSGGEPLLIDDCREYMGHLASKGKKFSFSTNGTLITPDIARFLAPNLKFLTISLNAASKEVHESVNVGSSYDQALSNIQLLRHERSRGNGDFYIIGRMTITKPALHEIPRFIRDYAEMGFDKINFGFDKATVPTYLNSHRQIKAKLRRDLTAALNETEDPSKVDIRQLRPLDLVGESARDRGWWEGWWEL